RLRRTKTNYSRQAQGAAVPGRSTMKLYVGGWAGGDGEREKAITLAKARRRKGKSKSNARCGTRFRRRADVEEEGFERLRQSPSKHALKILTFLCELCASARDLPFPRSLWPLGVVVALPGSWNAPPLPDLSVRA